MKIKKLIFLSLYLFFLLILVDVFANIIKVRPLLWKNSFYSYLNVGWYTWHGADHLYQKKEIHSKQKNGFQTRGLKPNKKFSKNIILLGDSAVETSHRINEMPEKYLRDRLSKTNVISFGSWGWSTDQQLLHLEKYINDIKPQKVVLWFEINDILGNLVKHGFMGRKPFFEIKKNNDEYILSGPDTTSGKNYFEYSYFYRVINKALYYLEAKKNKNFLEIANNCSKNKIYTDEKIIAKLIYNENNYLQAKNIFNHYEKPYLNTASNIESNNTFPNFIEWEKNGINNFLKLDLGREYIGSNVVTLDPLHLLAEKQVDKAIYAEILTNKLLNRMQLLSNKNNSEFYVFFVYEKSRYEPFKNDEKITICYNNKELVYSNRSFQAKIKNVFKNIKNVAVINLEENLGDNENFTINSYGDGNFSIDNYDLFDGHKNNAANEYIMNEVYKFINE